MTFELKQRSESKAASEWKWSVWIAGTAAELASVDRVVYHLHPTFPDPIRTVTDRKNAFRLEETGWAEFEIVAHVKIRRGPTTTLRSWLKFRSPDMPGTPNSPSKPSAIQSVFVSSSLADVSFALELKRAFEKKKIRVMSADDASELGFPASLETMLRKTSGAVMLKSDKASPWARYELEAAVRAGVHVLEVQVGKTAKRGRLAMTEPSEADRVAKEIMEALAAASKDAREPSEA